MLMGIWLIEGYSYSQLNNVTISTVLGGYKQVRTSSKALQTVYRTIENPRVGSSILPPATSIYSHEY